jgi:hypothetical protein
VGGLSIGSGVVSRGAGVGSSTGSTTSAGGVIPPTESPPLFVLVLIPTSSRGVTVVMVGSPGGSPLGNAPFGVVDAVMVAASYVIIMSQSKATLLPGARRVATVKPSPGLISVTASGDR